MSINKVILVGRLTKDPEQRFMTNGEAVANFSMATNETWKDKSGTKQEKVEFHNCVAYRRTAEVVSEYVHKGDQLYVEGKLQTRKWQDKEGRDKYTTEIIVDKVDFIGGKREGGEHTEKPARQDAPASKPAPAMGGGFDDFDDDIPF